jgi:hypothetical protein
VESSTPVPENKKRAAGNPLSAGGSQGPLLLPKVEDTSKLDHTWGECKRSTQRQMDFDSLPLREFTSA